MTIKDVAKEMNISTRTLRNYDKMGLLNPHRSTSGYRLYSDEDVEIIREILHLRKSGLRLKDIKELINNPTSDKNTILHSHLQSLERQKKTIETNIRYTKQLLDEM